MGELMLVREAERSGEARADPERLREEREWLQGRMHTGAGQPELLEATGATPAELEALVVRRVVAEQFLTSVSAPTAPRTRRWRSPGRRSGPS